MPKKPSRDSAIPFVDMHGHTIRLSGRMTLGELFKMGFVRVSLEKPGSPMREGEWRNAPSPQ